MYNQRPRGTFTAPASDAELERILAEHCAECGDKHRVATEPAEWSLLELRSIDVLDEQVRARLIEFRKLDKNRSHFICFDCAAELSND